MTPDVGDLNNTSGHQSDPLLKLAPSELRTLAFAVRAARISSPFTAAKLQRIVGEDLATEIGASLDKLAGCAAVTARALELLAEARTSQPALDDVVDLVTTGPEGGGRATRSTAAVVTELFQSAQQSVLVAGYAVHQGRRVFEALAARMTERADLSVEMFLDIQRPRGDTSTALDLERRFARRFCETQWPIGTRLPVIYFDPRSLTSEGEGCAALHAKCIVVDARAVFISSANFTEAAHERNFELGLLLRSPKLADRVRRFFQVHVDAGLLRRIAIRRGASGSV